MSLPSPRTLKEAQIELICNAVGLMSDEQFVLFYREVGPFCMEVLLDSTKPDRAKSSPASEPARSSVERISKDESAMLIQRLRNFLGEDGWTRESLDEVFKDAAARGPFITALLKNGADAKPLTAEKAQMIRAFLECEQ